MVRGAGGSVSESTTEVEDLGPNNPVAVTSGGILNRFGSLGAGTQEEQSRD